MIRGVRRENTHEDVPSVPLMNPYTPPTSECVDPVSPREVRERWKAGVVLLLALVLHGALFIFAYWLGLISFLLLPLFSLFTLASIFILRTVPSFKRSPLKYVLPSLLISLGSSFLLMMYCLNTFGS